MLSINYLNSSCIICPLHYFPIQFYFSDQKGSYFFPGMVKNTAKFVKPCSKKIIDWIKALKDGKQKVFLLTNSYIDYTNLLMKYAVG